MGPPHTPHTRATHSAHMHLIGHKVVIIKDEESAAGTSGSMGINLPLRSYLGPINCRPCQRRAGTPVDAAA